MGLIEVPPDKWSAKEAEIIDGLKALASKMPDKLVIKPLVIPELFMARTDPTGVFVKGKSGFRKVAEFEFDPPMTIRNGDSYTVEGDEYFLRDEHGNLLQSGKVILKS